jgi:hypothetical protein
MSDTIQHQQLSCASTAQSARLLPRHHAASVPAVLLLLAGTCLQQPVPGVLHCQPLRSYAALLLIWPLLLRYHALGLS